MRHAVAVIVERDLARVARSARVRHVAVRAYARLGDVALAQEVEFSFVESRRRPRRRHRHIEPIGIALEPCLVAALGEEKAAHIDREAGLDMARRRRGPGRRGLGERHGRLAAAGKARQRDAYDGSYADRSDAVSHIRSSGLMAHVRRFCL